MFFSLDKCHCDSQHLLKMVPESVLWLPSNTKDTFEETYKSVHEGIEYPCTHCEYKAKRRDHIQKHLQMVHDGIRYPCPHCDHQASAKYNLKIHIECVHDVINPVGADVSESLVWPGGALSAPPPRKSMKELSETPCCYLEVRPLSKLRSHEEFRVEISKTGWDFIIWKFEEIEISPWVDSQKYP